VTDKSSISGNALLRVGYHGGGDDGSIAAYALASFTSVTEYKEEDDTPDNFGNKVNDLLVRATDGRSEDSSVGVSTSGGCRKEKSPRMLLEVAFSAATTSVAASFLSMTGRMARHAMGSAPYSHFAPLRTPDFNGS
jgi:hypothetical protein